MAPGIPLPDMAQLAPEVKALVASFPMNVFKMAANAPGNVKAFMELAKSVLFGSAFEPRKREIAVLRVAR